MGEEFQPRGSAGPDGGVRGAGALVFPQVDSLKHLLEAGASVNAPPDPREQSPVHLAAGGGLACFLLWQLQTGADLNQQVTRLPIVAVCTLPSTHVHTHTSPTPKQQVVAVVIGL